MSEESPRFLPRRRSNTEPERPDYSEPDFSSWASKLDQFVAVRTPGSPDPEEASAPAAAPAKSASLTEGMANLLAFDGAMCVALVDSESGMVIDQAGSGIDIERAAASASMILRTRRSTIKALGLPDQIDDLLVTLTSQLHIIRPLSDKPTVFIYLIVDRSKASLAMARFKVTEADGQLHL